ncbi:magnesium-dependent phosphatase-1, partial [Lactarius akahatsu]
FVCPTRYCTLHLMTIDSRLPKLIAFDLDYTLWPLWIDTHINSSLKRDGDTLNEVHDKHGDIVAFYDDVPQILHRLRAAGVVIAACSRTTASALARQALSLLTFMPATRFFDQKEIYPGSKITHFKQLHKKTGISYSEMLFFDDELRNKEVESLGVLASWRSRNPEISLEETASSSASDGKTL